MSLISVPVTAKTSSIIALSSQIAISISLSRLRASIPEGSSASKLTSRPSGKVKLYGCEPIITSFCGNTAVARKIKSADVFNILSAFQDMRLNKYRETVNQYNKEFFDLQSDVKLDKVNKYKRLRNSALFLNNPATSQSVITPVSLNACHGILKP